MGRKQAAKYKARPPDEAGEGAGKERHDDRDERPVENAVRDVIKPGPKVRRFPAPARHLAVEAIQELPEEDGGDNRPGPPVQVEIGDGRRESQGQGREDIGVDVPVAAETEERGKQGRDEPFVKEMSQNVGTVLFTGDSVAVMVTENTALPFAAFK